MTRRQELQDHRDSLVEIRNIMNSMKTLAYLETHKLENVLQAQRTIVSDIEKVARDFLAFHPELLSQAAPATEIFLVIGSERGFCGDFNQTLVRQLEAVLADREQESVRIIAVGRKLHAALADKPYTCSLIPGANAVEEGAALLNQIVDTLDSLASNPGMINLYTLYNGGEDGPVMSRLLPPFQHLDIEPRTDNDPPLLYIPEKDFLSDVVEHYMLAVLQEACNASLMAENRRRLQHMEGAVKHLDETATDLLHRCQALRQEEITEEIEVIMLNAVGLAGNNDHPI